MIKTFIFVEDGSVDLDELKSSVGDDVLVIPYRQGGYASHNSAAKRACFEEGGQHKGSPA